MFKRLFTAAILFGAASTAPPAAHAQTVCTQRQSIVEQLSTKHTEQLSALGYQTGAQVLEVWSSSETGSWTLLVTRPDGISCVVATGSNWTQHIPARQVP
ncbi:MAG: hypothetical protein U1D35_16540, partial [Paracoccaceae bacterium]|nr:hypothetical protein [Paracoccaceae bacterium]